MYAYTSLLLILDKHDMITKTRTLPHQPSSTQYYTNIWKPTNFNVRTTWGNDAGARKIRAGFSLLMMSYLLCNGEGNQSSATSTVSWTCWWNRQLWRLLLRLLSTTSSFQPASPSAASASRPPLPPPTRRFPNLSVCGVRLVETQEVYRLNPLHACKSG